MTPRFNLIDDPWIVVLRADGSPETVSLTALFDRAREFARIGGDLPTQAFAVIRLALAVLHRSIGPADGADWRALWTSSGLPVGDIAAYLGSFRHRFELFDPATPFYQVADLTTKKAELGLAAFIADIPTGSPKYTTRAAEGRESIGFGEAARWLVHCQAFDLSGIKGAADGDPRSKGGKSYPIGPGSAGRLGGVYVEGRDLRETLLLNLIPDSFIGDQYLAGDLPVWEREPHGPAPEPRETEGAPTGLLDLYTWQSRRLRLVTDGSAVTGALICQGDRLELRDRFACEPMTAWRRSENQEKILKRPRVYLPQRHDPDRSVWRGLAASLPALSEGVEAGSRWTPPLVTGWIGDAHTLGLLDRGARIHYHATGIAYGTQEAVITELIDDRLSVAAAVFEAGNRELAATVADGAADAENAVKALSSFARDLARAGGGRDGVDGAASTAAVAAYAALDTRYRQWLGGLDQDTDTDAARSAWRRSVRSEILACASRLLAAAGPAAWRGRGEGKDFVNSAVAANRFRDRIRRALSPAPAPDPKRTADV